MRAEMNSWEARVVIRSAKKGRQICRFRKLICVVLAGFSASDIKLLLYLIGRSCYCTNVRTCSLLTEQTYDCSSHCGFMLMCLSVSVMSFTEIIKEYDKMKIPRAPSLQHYKLARPSFWPTCQSNILREFRSDSLTLCNKVISGQFSILVTISLIWQIAFFWI